MAFFEENKKQKEYFEEILLLRQKIEEIVADRTKELAEANTSLARSNEELAQFAYIASHDLKAPLRGISSLAIFLQADYADKLDAALSAVEERIEIPRHLAEILAQRRRLGVECRKP